MREQEVRELYEAYLQVHQPQEEVEQLDEFLGSGAANFVDKATKAVQTGLEKLGMPINRTPRGTVTGPQQKQKNEGNVKEDLFDIIKGHLLDEGYADTEEAATAIMANMSEEWKQSIVEQTPPFIEDLYDYKDGGGKAKEAQGMSKQSVIELGRKNRDRLTGLKGDGSRVSQSHQRTYTQMGGDARARQLGIRPDGTYK
jgi:hypothetical protein